MRLSRMKLSRMKLSGDEKERRIKSLREKRTAEDAKSMLARKRSTKASRKLSEHVDAK